jgi:hypothetical protein
MGGKIPKPWTEYDIEQLRTLVGKRSTAQIATMLDRTKVAIIQRAFELRLSLKVRAQEEAPPADRARNPQSRCGLKGTTPET